MTTAEIVNAVINGVTAIATFIATFVVAYLAIWGDFVRARLAGPKLSLALHNFRGLLVGPIIGTRTIYYHLRVDNARKGTSATNCRVVLKKMWRRGPDYTFQEITLAVPLTFQWAPSDSTPPYITLRNDQVLDFGIVREEERRFSPLLHSYTVGFNCFVASTESRIDKDILCGDGNLCIAKKRLQQSWLKLEVDQGVHHAVP